MQNRVIFAILIVGVFIGILFGIGINDWHFLIDDRSKVKITDWIVALCTVGVLFGTWTAASYAKKAAHQAQIQNNNAIISKIDDMQAGLIREMDEIKPLLNNLKDMFKDIEKNESEFISYKNIILRILDNISNSNLDVNIYRYKLFLTNIVNFEDFNEIIWFINFIKESNVNLIYMELFKIDKKIFMHNLIEEINIYLKLTEDLSKKINDKYQELNGCS